MEPLYNCLKCGKTVYKKFGSGKYCSRSCANSREMTDDLKRKISDGLAKTHVCNCVFCGKVFNTKASRASHEKLCKSNPNAASPIRRKKDLLKPYKTKDGSELDISYEYLIEYSNSHNTCEICGRSVGEATKWNSNKAPKKLCVDHDHKTNKFRGLLCGLCNRQLGWYENNKEKINSYLSK